MSGVSTFLKVVGSIIFIILLLAFMYVIASLPSVKSWYRSFISNVEKSNPQIAEFIKYL